MEGVKIWVIIFVVGGVVSLGVVLGYSRKFEWFFRIYRFDVNIKFSDSYCLSVKMFYSLIFFDIKIIYKKELSIIVYIKKKNVFYF